MADLQRILVVKLADLGDLLTATPALRALRARYPAAHITVLTTPHAAPLLAGNDAVDRIITFPKALYDRPRDLLAPSRAARGAWLASSLAVRLRAGHFDAAVLLHHLTTPGGRAKYWMLVMATWAAVRAGLDNGRGHYLTHRALDRGFGAHHEVDYWLGVVETLGATNPSPRMELHLTDAELAEAGARWTAMGLEGHDVVALHPGSGAFSLARRWPAERFAAVGEALVAEGLRVAVVAGPGEEGVAAEVRRAMASPAAVLEGIDSPRALAALLGRARLFVGNDSGVMHCAAAVGVPVVAVFGLSNHRAWGPYPPERHRVVRLDLPCSPCFYTGHQLGTPQGCPPRVCLDELAPKLVIEAAIDLLGQKSTGRSSGVWGLRPQREG